MSRFELHLGLGYNGHFEGVCHEDDHDNHNDAHVLYCVHVKLDARFRAEVQDWLCGNWICCPPPSLPHEYDDRLVNKDQSHRLQALEEKKRASK